VNLYNNRYTKAELVFGLRCFGIS